MLRLKTFLVLLAVNIVLLLKNISKLQVLLLILLFKIGEKVSMDDLLQFIGIFVFFSLETRVKSILFIYIL